jgi:hypothetical protein
MADDGVPPATIADACPHCAAGHPVSLHNGNGTPEYVHRMSAQAGTGSRWSITICRADKIRKGLVK